MMTKFIRCTTYVILLFSLLFSCTDTEDPPAQKQVGNLTITPVQLGKLEFNQVEGEVTTNFTITNDELWILNGGLSVEDGATLTIEAGATIYAAFNEATSYLTVQRGGKIIADGTADTPINFTTIRELTSIPQPGDWGGIIINGKAPVNLAGGEGEGEGGTGTYGGSDPEDNSGVLRYVVVAYAGKQLGPDNELNGFSLNGVGRGTTVEYVEAIYGKDDGIEFFGGTVNIKYALSLGNADDSFDWSYGWSGLGQFWVVQQDPFGGDRAIEADNNEDDFLASPFSQPIVSNLTLLGADDGDGENTGVKLRNGTRGLIYNALVSNFPKDGVDVDESSEGFISSNELVFSHSRVFSNNLSGNEGVNYRNATSFEQDGSNQVTIPPTLDGFVGIIAGEGFDPITLNNWFSSVDYIGAVDPNTNWTLGWIKILR
ncbi:MAG: hypothetical protein AAGE93_01275 [Bacteroidota bacterium]